MVKLTNLNDLLTSLISKALGRSFFTVNVYLTSLTGVVMEFYYEGYKFIISRKGDALRIYDNGNIYLISDILPENYIEQIDEILKHHAENLSAFYKFSYVKDKFNKDTEANVYKFVKHDT